MSEFAEYKERAGSCPYCGNSPTNHIFTYVTQTFATIMGIGIHKLSERKWFKAISIVINTFLNILSRHHYFFSSGMSIVTFNSTDVSKAKSYRSQVVWEEAKRRGIQMEQILIYRKLTDLYRAKIRGKWFYFDSIPMPAELDQTNALWMDDKFLVKEVLSAHDVPVPKYVMVTTENGARRGFENVGSMVIVKPRVGSRGRHTTTHIKTVEDAVKAFKSAQVLNHFVSIEEHLHGSVCRATVINGKLAGFFEAKPPRIVGDGLLTVNQLVAKNNANRLERVQEIFITSEHVDVLKRQGYTLDSVPEKGVRVDLIQRTGRLFGGETRELLSTVHPKLRSYIEKAGVAVAAPVIGFDLIIENPETDPDTQRWGIIEANSLPFIDLHYLPLHGTPSNPASAVWDMWFEKKTA